MLTDIRHAIRTLIAVPGFTLVAVLTLALGIGGNTAVFSVTWQALWKPLPFPAEERLVVVNQTYGINRRTNPIAPANFLDWKTENRTFEALGGYSQYTQQYNLTGAVEPQTLEVGNVTPELFTVLGIAPVLGRPLVPADAATEDSSAIVLVESAWRAKFGSDQSVIGRKASLNGDVFEIVGVVPDSITIGSVEAEAFAPFSLAGEVGGRRQAFYMGAVGRLRPGVSLAQANDDLQAISARAAVAHADTNKDLSARASSFRERLSSDIRPAVLMLSCGAALVLLIACANLAGLQLARHARRQREIAIRAAIGATRFRIARALAIEGLAVALAGGYAGLTLGMWALATLRHFAPPPIARDIVVRPDLAVLAYCLAVSLLSAVAFGAWPGWRAAARPVAAVLGGRGISGDRAGTRIRMALVSGEVALALVVLVGAALLVTSLVNVLRLDPGFEFNQGLVADLVLPQNDYPTLESKVRFFDEAIARVGGLPGVDGACVINRAPLAGQKGGMTFVADGETRLVGALPSNISPGCIDLLKIPLLSGHVFSPTEPGAPVLISASMARGLFKGADPIGRRIHMGLPDGALMTVVGVVGNIRSSALESPFSNQVWMVYTQPYFGPQQLLVRTSVPPTTHGGCGAVAHPRAGSPPAHDEHEDDGRSAGRSGGGAAVQHAAPARVCGVRAGALRAGHLRSARADHGAAHPGNRRPPGARREGGRRRAAGGRRHRDGGGDRRGRRDGSGGRSVPPVEGHVVRGDANRAGRVHGDRRRLDGRGAGRRLAAGAPRDADRSDDRLAP